MAYVGRFAPSPSGPLHQGSLVAAVGSYLQAKANDGVWLVRIEDIDPPREMPGATDRILHSLDAHGLYWDHEIVYQSQRLEVYEHVFQQLQSQGIIYECYCSKKKINALNIQGIDGFCHPPNCIANAETSAGKLPAQRIRTEKSLIQFSDKKYKAQECILSLDIGDFIIKRADGIIAYHLAVVVDDQWQHVTEVVRGKDLLTQTFRHIFLQTLLGYTIPQYFHLPLVLADDGIKLSKQTGAPALNDNTPAQNLFEAYKTLALNPISSINHLSVEESLQWAICAWKEQYCS